MIKNKLLGIEVENESKDKILEKIIKNTLSQKEFIHIVSINPEICVAVQSDNEFKKVVERAQIKIVDGIGIILAAKLLGLSLKERFHGVDLMSDLLSEAHRRSLRVMLIGGGDKIAESIANRQNRIKSEAKFYGIQGIKDIKNPTLSEEKNIFSIVADVKPHIVFVSFGSPSQELWIYRNRAQFEGCVCMGVGGAFDFISGKIPRAPHFIRKFGFEWLYRLIRQPWRLKRQIKFIKFVYLVLYQRAQQILSGTFKT